MLKSFAIRVYLIALVARVIPVLLTRSLGIGLDDMFQYDMLARTLAAGHGYRWYAAADLQRLLPYVKFDLSSATNYDPRYGMYTSFRAPLYPAFLAAVYLVFGSGAMRFFAARLAQAVLLGAPLAPLTLFTARELFADGDQTARRASLVVACYPMLLVYPLGLGTENLFFVLLLAAVLFVLRSARTPTVMNLLLGGVLLALTALTRSVILLFALLAIFYLLYLHRRIAVLAAIAFVVVIAPWIVRNSLLHGRLTGIETSMGYNLYLGYHPHGNGSFVFGPSLDLLTIMDDSVRDRVGTQRALEFIRADPGRVLPLAIARLGYFFGLEKRVLIYFYSNNLLGYIAPVSLLLLAAILLLPFVMLCLLAAFAIPALPWNRNTALLAILFVAYLLPHILILSEDRFHLALIPFLAIVSMGGWAALRASNRNRLTVSIIIVLLLVGNWGWELNRDAVKIQAVLSPHGNESHFSY